MVVDAHPWRQHDKGWMRKEALQPMLAAEQLQPHPGLWYTCTHESRLAVLYLLLYSSQYGGRTGRALTRHRKEPTKTAGESGGFFLIEEFDP
jgi:hypothetical protein